MANDTDDGTQTGDSAGTIEPRGVKLPQDYSTPFSAPSGQRDRTTLDHPQSDTNVDSTEWYAEGRDGALEVEDQTDDIAVIGYTPPKTNR